MNYRIMISLSWIIVFSWMVLIYLLSDQPAIQSSHLSESITEFIVGSSAEAVSFDRWNFLVRKNAHLFNYLVLGILVMNALTKSLVSRYRSVVWSCGICVLFACTDEFHQLFVAGRGAQLMDVLIDSVGALVGIGLYSLAAKVMRR